MKPKALNNGKRVPQQQSQGHPQNHQQQYWALQMQMGQWSGSQNGQMMDNYYHQNFQNFQTCPYPQPPNWNMRPYAYQEDLHHASNHRVEVQIPKNLHQQSEKVHDFSNGFYENYDFLKNNSSDEGSTGGRKQSNEELAPKTVQKSIDLIMGDEFF